MTETASLWVMWKAGIYFCQNKPWNRRYHTETSLSSFFTCLMNKARGPHSHGAFFNGLKGRLHKLVKDKPSAALKWEGKKSTSDWVFEHENLAAWETALGKRCCELTLPRAAPFSCWARRTSDVSCGGGCFLPVPWGNSLWTSLGDFSVASLENSCDY